jgi:two-component system, chemotaxis family, protein-glutamate methylesterase/glutaminase
MAENSNNAGRLDENQHIIVIGASSGGFEALKKIAKALPSGFEPPIMIVWHMSPDVRGILPQALNRISPIYAVHAHDGEELGSNRIYVAPPDHHMILEDGKIRVTRGPKENRFRPAIDPLFRSAAYAYGNRVIGVILSGGLDDGTAGLWAVKHYGGIAVVQDPSDAEVPSMPENAAREVKVDHCLPVSEIAELLVRLSKQPITKNTMVVNDQETKKEIEIAAEKNTMHKNFLGFGKLTPYTCPECHGVLSRLQNDNIVRYRCHTGHAYSADSLLTAIGENIEDSLYNAIRGIHESVILLNHLGDHYAEVNNPKLAALYFKKAQRAAQQAEVIRQAALSHEQYSKDSLRHLMEDSRADIVE